MRPTRSPRSDLRLASSLGAAVFAAVLFTGCASAPDVRVHQAEGGVAQCKSFAWHSTSDRPASLAEQRIRAEAMQVLQAKGYATADEKPDCRIAYDLSMQERPRSGPNVGVGVGGGSRGVGGGIGVSVPVGRDAYTGTLTLDVIDAARNEQIWSGALEGGTRSAEPSQEELQRAVQKILAEFPDRAPQ